MPIMLPRKKKPLVKRPRAKEAKKDHITTTYRTSRWGKKIGSKVALTWKRKGQGTDDYIMSFAARLAKGGRN